MGLLHKSLNKIGIEDIELLKLNSVQEGKQIDYKINLADDSKFLSSVCSFANCMGGDLVLGISEEKGIPTSCPGLLVPDFDAEVNRLENMIRDGIEPRITGIAYHRVRTTDGRAIIVIRIPRSWSMPHRVKRTRRFFSRHSAGKYELDMPEIRSAFALSDTVLERITAFRTNRLSQIISGETPVVLRKGPKLIFHIIPFTAFDPLIRYDSAAIEKCMPEEIGWRRRHNFDGYLISEHEDNYAMSYLQLFRNGALELVDDQHFRAVKDNKGRTHLQIMPPYEVSILNKMPSYLKCLKDLGVSPPLVLALSFTEVLNHSIFISGMHTWSMYKKNIEKKDLIIPGVLMEDYDAGLPSLLKPVFDSVWNAAGLPHSIYFNERGEWDPKRPIS